MLIYCSICMLRYYRSEVREVEGAMARLQGGIAKKDEVTR